MVLLSTLLSEINLTKNNKNLLFSIFSSSFFSSSSSSFSLSTLEINQIFTLLYEFFESNNEKERILCSELLNQFLNVSVSTSVTINFEITSLILNKCSYFIDHISLQFLKEIQTRNELNSFLKCFEMILRNEEFNGSLKNKIDLLFVKLLNHIIKLLQSFHDGSNRNTGIECLLGLNILRIFYKSRGKLINNSFGSVINNLCLDFVLFRSPLNLSTLGDLGQDIIHTAVEVMAINASFSSVEQYQTIWLNITEG